MDTQKTIQTIVEQVKRVEGVNAIVLGGSRARGTHTPTSDIDLCVYYHPDQPLNLTALDRVAAEFDDDHRTGIMTPIGGWGPWINGGGWLTVHSQPVDLLYRDLERVHDVVEACLAGQVEMAYQPGHPHGFASSIYLAEVALCQPLWAADAQIAQLKNRVQPYPPTMQEALIQQFTWEIDFSLLLASKGADRADVAYVAGCCFQCAACMLQVLFALNEQFWLNEKGALSLANTFSLRPARLQSRIEDAFALLTADRRSLKRAIEIVERVSGEVNALIANR